MNALVLGARSFVGRAVAAALRDAGDDVLEADAASGVGTSERFDVVVDATAPEPGAVRDALTRLAGRFGRYLLVSSHEVYPNVPGAPPWREEDFDPWADTSPTRARSAERELALSRVPWTIVRPAFVEGADDPTERTSWLLARILDGGPVVLPDGGPGLYRHVHVEDLARAIGVVARSSRTVGKMLNVTSDGLLTPAGHALMLMDGLGRRVPIQWVPTQTWRSAGLAEPPGSAESSSLLAPSPLLTELGWTPRPEIDWVMDLARTLSARPARIDGTTRAIERRVLEEARRTTDFEVAPGRTQHETRPWWELRATPGQPASLHAIANERVPKRTTPVLRVVDVTLGETTERLLTGDLPAPPQPIIVGHAALVEIVEPGPTGLVPGRRFLPIHAHPCGDASCAACSDGIARTVGVDVDGYGAAFVSVPPAHLVPVPENLGRIALLAHPLARLVENLSPLLAGEGPVWILGTTVEAALALQLAQDAGRSALCVDLTPPETSEPRVLPLRQLREAVLSGTRERPTLAVNLSGSRAGENLVADALASGATLLTPFELTGLRTDIQRTPLPPVALRKESLERAIDVVARWASFRNLDTMLGPQVSPSLVDEVLLSPVFSLTSVTGDRA